jgi:hypothetical protein
MRASSVGAQATVQRTIGREPTRRLRGSQPRDVGDQTVACGIADRQAEIRRRLKARGIATNQAAQSLWELRAIPDGAWVRVHLLRSANNATAEDLDALAGFDLAHGKPRGKQRRRSPAHVGRSTYLQWDARLASPRIQRLTRYAFFDPGGTILDAIDAARVSMTVELFRTMRDEAAAIVSPTGGRPIRFESQPDGFGMIWPTRLDVVDALRRALPALPEPDDDDQATVVSEGQSVRCPTREVVTVASATADRITLVRLEIGTAALAWAQGVGDAPAAQPQMSFGDDWYQPDRVRSLLARTADIPADTKLDAIVRVADSALRAHIRPAA